MQHLDRTNLGTPLRQRDVGGMRVSAAIYAGSSALPTHEHGHAYLCLVAAGGYRQSCPGRNDECSHGLLLVHPEGHRHANRFYPRGARCLDLFIPPVMSQSPGVRHLLSDYRQLRLPGAENLQSRIERELAADDDAAGLALQAAVLDLIAQAVRIPNDTHRPVWMPRVIERLRDTPQATPSLVELAGIAGVHPAHLARTFKRVHGVSVGEYQRGLRVTLACRALRNRSRSIADIAAEAGFSDQSHFARVFRRLTGQTPSAYRISMQIPSREVTCVLDAATAPRSP
jgi:AraC family transcriptional regulator